MRTISANVNKVKGRHDTFFRRCISAGRASEGLRADWQRDLATARRECGFEYVRFHGTLNDEMGVYLEDKQGNPVYNWQYIDALYDYLLSLGMTPFVELAFMPAALASGTQTVFWWKGNVTPPKSHARWEALVRELVQHWTGRYGRDEVRKWYFEVWNEPNLNAFWAGSRADYFKLYKSAAAGVKCVCDDYRVGGPATARHDWVPEMIRWCRKSGTPLDFVSTHTYGISNELDEFATAETFLLPDPGPIIEGMRRVRKQVDASATAKLELHYTEWSSSSSARDPLHDSYVTAPYILSRIKRVEGCVDSMSYWTFTDIFEEPGIAPTPLHGGFGLMNLQGLMKPAFFAFQFLNRLGETELKCDDPDAWVCRDGRGGVQALLYNWTYHKQDVNTPNRVFYARDLPAAPIGPVRVALSGLEPGTYRVAAWRVGYRSNDVYTDYLDMGSPRNLSPEQVRQLRDRNCGAPLDVGVIKVESSGPRSVLQKDFGLRQNDVLLVTVER
jgi:xylan 1,4-beta-xylosidase